MDGFKKQLNASIQRKLSFSVSLTIVVVALLAGLFSFIAAFNEAQELQDDTLEQVAMLFDRQALVPLDSGSEPESPDDSRVIVQHLADGATAANAPLPLPATLPDGLHTLKVNGQTLRVLVKTTARTERIALAQDTDARDEIAQNSAWHALLPLLVLVPVVSDDIEDR